MAVNTVSAINPETWQLVQETVISSATATVTVATGISGYSRLMLVVSGVTLSASATIDMRFNSDSTSGNYGSNVWGGGTNSSSDTGIRLVYATTTSPGTGYAMIENANNTTIPKITRSTGAERWSEGYGIWNSTAAITSVTVVPSTGNVNAGTFRLYGIAG